MPTRPGNICAAKLRNNDMMKLKRMLALCLSLALVCLPVSAAETESEAAPTLSPILVGVQELEQIPQRWNPLEEHDAGQDTLLALTSESLYRISGDGAVIPAQAAALPEDVTAEYAGSYGIPAGTIRGYAFAITLREGVLWDNGTALTAADWCYTAEKLLETGAFPLEIANYEAYRRGDTLPASRIVSLQDAGYATVTEAEEAGYHDFYIDTTWFWGLDTGWFRVTDRTRLFDAAIPSGCEEMYITPAYLYRTYLGENGSQKLFQSEFVGIPAESGAALTMADVGLFAEDGRLILILQEQAAASTVALALSGLYPVPMGTQTEAYGTAASYHACGPYRIESVSDTELVLIPNSLWNGEAALYERIRITAAS